MAQSRMAVLASELQAARESHMIVLETKDAMMHSLVQQNTQLIAQQEESSARTEELEAKVNQLTQLLRTVTAPIISPRVPRLDGLNSASAFTAIKGGRGGPDTPKKIIEF